MSFLTIRVSLWLGNAGERDAESVADAMLSALYQPRLLAQQTASPSRERDLDQRPPAAAHLYVSVWRIWYSAWRRGWENMLAPWWLDDCIRNLD